MSPGVEVVPLVDVPSPTDVARRPVVLVVDDEQAIADTLSIILSKNGFAPLAAYDGKSALELAEVIPPDLLLSDVVMPGMNGVQLAIAMMKKVSDCKVLLFSGQSSTVDLLAQARNEGHNFVALPKPIHPKVLLTCIARALEGREPIDAGFLDALTAGNGVKNAE